MRFRQKILKGWTKSQYNRVENNRCREYIYRIYTFNCTNSRQQKSDGTLEFYNHCCACNDEFNHNELNGLCFMLSNNIILNNDFLRKIFL